MPVNPQTPQTPPGCMIGWTAIGVFLWGFWLLFGFPMMLIAASVILGILALITMSQ